MGSRRANWVTDSPGVVQELGGLDGEVLDFTSDIVNLAVDGLVLGGGLFVDLFGGFTQVDRGRFDDVANLAGGAIAGLASDRRATAHLAHGTFLGGPRLGVGLGQQNFGDLVGGLATDLLLELLRRSVFIQIAEVLHPFVAQRHFSVILLLLLGGTF